MEFDSPKSRISIGKKRRFICGASIVFLSVTLLSISALAQFHATAGATNFTGYIPSARLSIDGVNLGPGVIGLDAQYWRISDRSQMIFPGLSYAFDLPLSPSLGIAPIVSVTPAGTNVATSAYALRAGARLNWGILEISAQALAFAAPPLQIAGSPFFSVHLGFRFGQGPLFRLDDGLGPPGVTLGNEEPSDRDVPDRDAPRPSADDEVVPAQEVSERDRLCQNSFLRTLTFRVEPTEPPVGTPVDFVAPTSPCNISLTDHGWDFTGDGVVDGQGARASHVFTEPGPQTVSLSVEDILGNAGRATQSLVVHEAPEAGQAPTDDASSGFGAVIPTDRPDGSFGPVFSAGMGRVADLTLYRAAAGLSLSDDWAVVLGAGYGSTESERNGYPTQLDATAIDAQASYRIAGGWRIGAGAGLLLLNGEYRIDWPVDGPTSFATTVPFGIVSVGYQWRFLMINLGVSLALQ